MWDDHTQVAAEQWLCVGYVVVEKGGSLSLTLTQKRSFVYIKDNGATHAALRTRVLGTIGGSSARAPGARWRAPRNPSGHSTAASSTRAASVRRAGRCIQVHGQCQCQCQWHFGPGVPLRQPECHRSGS